MGELLAALAMFTAFHALPSTPLRGRAIARLGRNGFMALYSLISLALLGWLLVAFFRADVAVWWVTPLWLRYLSAAVMLVAFVLLAASLMRRPMVLLTAETVLAAEGAVIGVVRLTRHPFLWALALWALVHTLNNPDPAGLALFGYFLLLAAAGTLPIDRRRARLLGETRWRQLQAETSNLPLAAVVSGRQSLPQALREIGWPPLLAGIVAWALVLHFHAALFGMPIFY
jgi:uncharacterized membrane protein